LRHRVGGPPNHRGDEFHLGNTWHRPPQPVAEGFEERDIYIPDLHIDRIKVKARDFW
jgi:error-prone DNA polymerase